MDISFVIARLNAELAGQGLKAIGGAADLDAAAEGVLATPSLFVIPLNESGGANKLIGGTSQRMQQEFGVINVVANRRDAMGKAALDDLAGIRAALKAALIGWVPFAETGESVLFSSGRLLRFDEGRIWWLDSFSITTFYRAA